MSVSEQVEAKKELREREREHKLEQQKIREAFNADGELSRSWLKEILDTEDLEELLDDYELRKIRGLINRQWVLGKLSEAQVHDRWYKLEVMKLKIYGEFPPRESSIQGPIRAFLFDDPTENLTALTAEQRNAIDQIIMSLQNMVTRSEDGFERKQMNTRYAGTESRDGRDDDGGGTLSLFG